MCLKDDGLDPSHYVSAPRMFNDSLYKSSRAEFKLMTNMDEYLTTMSPIRKSREKCSSNVHRSLDVVGFLDDGELYLIA
ncbi:hypothetical protein RhiirC2_769833 [Rhizophagus irregularis]|uniref:Uncharacterized protein n=1 Tax=Rhizophagus irregularis TaxID=588596 RepID=A0A2N1NY45_9GLOM|nr:hypothetical protein RhiirC2_769833 [Rhizophagus irregularis]